MTQFNSQIIVFIHLDFIIKGIQDLLPLLIKLLAQQILLFQQLLELQNPINFKKIPIPQLSGVFYFVEQELIKLVDVLVDITARFVHLVQDVHFLVITHLLFLSLPPCRRCASGGSISLLPLSRLFDLSVARVGLKVPKGRVLLSNIVMTSLRGFYRRGVKVYQFFIREI